MNGRQARSSLPDLREKTDRQLIVLATRDIERALDLAGRRAFAEAEAMYVQAKTLLDVARAPDGERCEIEARLNRTRAAIERARSAARTFTQSASC